MYIAVKEIRRSLGRFLLLTSAVALLVLLLLFFQAVGGSLTQGLTGAIEGSSADVLVYDERARRNPSASVLAPDAVEDVAAIEGVVDAAPIAITIATGRSDAIEPEEGAPVEEGGAQVDVALFGGDGEGASVPAEISEGRLPDAAGEALVGETALSAAFAVGDEVTVGPTTFTIVGRSDGAAFSVLPTLYVGLEDYTAVVQDRAGTPIDVPLSLVGVTVGDGADPAAVAQAITEGVDGVEALDRATAVAELPGVGTVTQSFSILYLLLFIVVTIVTGVFFLILTVQKRASLVLLRAVGAGRRDVLVPVLLQVVGVVGIGAVLGAGAASGLLWLARDTFGSTVSPTTALLTVGAILALGLVASLGAVRRVLAIDPVEAVNPSGI